MNNIEQNNFSEITEKLTKFEKQEKFSNVIKGVEILKTANKEDTEKCNNKLQNILGEELKKQGIDFNSALKYLQKKEKFN